MRKLVYVFAALFILSVISCTGKAEKDVPDNDSDSIVIPDTTVTAKQVTGVAIDGAMNSVYLKVGDDTIQFSYPELDSDHRAAWEIDDTLTVRYYVTENGDSVTEVINETTA